MVWWAAILSRRDSETACDAGAIQRLGEQQRAAYGRTLLAMTCPPGPKFFQHGDPDGEPAGDQGAYYADRIPT
ncbi:MAG: M56 family metallopeptidase [Evtepia sp.]